MANTEVGPGIKNVIQNILNISRCVENANINFQGKLYVSMVFSFRVTTKTNFE